MRTNFYLLALVILLQSVCFSQKRTDSFVSISLGSSNYIGDLAPLKKQVNNVYLQARPALSLGYTKYVTEKLFVESKLTLNTIFADDNILNKNATELKDLRSFTRGLHFRNNLIGLNVIGGYSPLHSPKQSLSPYFATGLSFFYSNPKTKVNDKWIALMPLNLNRISTGSPKNYRKLNFGIPVAIGVPLFKKDKINVYFETNVIVPISDYLDDISSNPLQPSLYTNSELSIYDRSQEQFSAYSGINRTKLVNEYNRQRFNTPYQTNPFTSKIKDFGGLGDVRGDGYNSDIIYSFQLKLNYKIETSNLKCPPLK